MSRWVKFIVMISIGLAAGVLFSLWRNPLKVQDGGPENLRIDYKTDYVLMTAEVFASNRSLPEARQRLKLLGRQPPEEIIQDAIDFATPRYAASDVVLMRNLQVAIMAQNAAPGTDSP